VPGEVADKFKEYPMIDQLERANLKLGQPITQKLIVRSHYAKK